LIGLIERADGRNAWLLSSEIEDGIVVQTVVLAGERPMRGVAGSVVRIVTIPGAECQVVLVAEDRVYDASAHAEEQPVVIQPPA
jgi:hypothetical protein